MPELKQTLNFGKLAKEKRAKSCIKISDKIVKPPNYEFK